MIKKRKDEQETSKKIHHGVKGIEGYEDRGHERLKFGIYDRDVA